MFTFLPSVASTVSPDLAASMSAASRNSLAPCSGKVSLNNFCTTFASYGLSMYLATSNVPSIGLRKLNTLSKVLVAASMATRKPPFRLLRIVVAGCEVITPKRNLSMSCAT